MPDWAAIQRGGRGGAAPGLMPDMDVTDGQKLTLGDTTVTLIRLPGHTPGTIGMVVPAKFGGRTHNVAVMSGTQMPTQDSVADASYKGLAIGQTASGPRLYAADFHNAQVVSIPALIFDSASLSFHLPVNRAAASTGNIGRASANTSGFGGSCFGA